MWKESKIKTKVFLAVTFQAQKFRHNKREQQFQCWHLECLLLLIVQLRGEEGRKTSFIYGIVLHTVFLNLTYLLQHNVISSKGVYRIYYFLSEKIKRYRLCSKTSFEFLKIKFLNPRLLHRVFKKCIETRPTGFPQLVYMCANS